MGPRHERDDQWEDTMTTMCVYYKAPEDAAAFEKRYLEGHLPLTRAFPNIKDCSFSKVARRVAGPFPYEYVFVGVWADKESWKADITSEYGAKVTADALEFATQGFDVVTYEELS